MRSSCHRSPARACAASRITSYNVCYTKLLRTLAAFAPPPLAAEHWPAFAALMQALATPEGPWQGQIGQARDWYLPILEQKYEAAQARAGDLWQLERIAMQYATRERFLTELALDPPRATGDLAGAPLLDEDYLV